jgi:hypothetical protein
MAPRRITPTTIHLASVFKNLNTPLLMCKKGWAMPFIAKLEET